MAGKVIEVAASLIKAALGAVQNPHSRDSVTEIQVKRKLVQARSSKFEAYKHLEDDEMLKKIIELTHVENIMLKFSHLVDVVHGQDNFQEVREAKDCEKSRHVQIVNTPLKISIWGRDTLALEPLICSISNFLCTDYGAKHVCLTVGDVLLEWGLESLVITTTVKDGQEVCPNFEVNTTADQKAPHDSLQLKTIAEETYQCPLDKKPIFQQLAILIAKYNTKFYYHPISRNSQGFVRDALKALGVTRSKNNVLPASFARHGDLDGVFH